MVSVHILVLVLLLLVNYCIQPSLIPSEVVLYKDNFYAGDRTIITLNNCSNLEPGVLNTASSVKISGNCVQLYDSLNCSGNTIQISPVSPHRGYLMRWNFERKIESVGICNEPCIPEIGQSFLANGTHLTFKITLFSDPEFRGNAWSISINGCTLLNETTFWMNKLLKSVIVSENHCVLAFLGSPLEVTSDDPCVVKDFNSVLEFRDKMPGLNDISSWLPNFNPEKSIFAISPCPCKAVTGVNSEGLQKISDDDDDAKYIVLFSAPNFMSEYVKIPLNFSGCKTFDSDEKLQGWGYLTQSMAVPNGSCVMVFKEPNCRDYSSFKMAISDSVSYLSYYNLNRTIRSFRACNQTDDEFLKMKKGFMNIFLVHCTIPIASVSFFLSLILTGILVRKIYVRKMYKSRREKLSDQEISEFRNGLGLELNNTTILEHVYENIKNICNDGEAAFTKINSDLLVENQPYDYQLEIPFNLLHFGLKSPIGSGEYGNVFKGLLKSEGDLVPVAIKTTKVQSNGQYIRSLLKEVKILMYVGQHPKIITLIGCCTKNLHKGELFIVLEFCENGSLESYLKENRVNFLNFVHKGQICVPQNFVIKNKANIEAPISNTQYVPSILSLSAPVQEDSLEISAFNIQQLIKWSIEIAEGMEYLASKRVIHGDLSARNILLDANKVSKISDFGLSRKMYCYSLYKRNSEDPLPWRWLALESLKNMEFSTASDAWSYGILLWELFTLGEQPYPGVSALTNNFVINLEQGLRPTLPQFATSDCYDIMSECWDEEPSARPLFSNLSSSLKKIQTSIERKISGNKSGPIVGSIYLLHDL